MTRIPVLVCSPYAGDRAKNDAYLKACIADSLSRNEAPWASHGFYPQFLDDGDCDQRALGLECEHVWLKFAALVAVYGDLDPPSSGMALAIREADRLGIKVERRSLPGWPK